MMAALDSTASVIWLVMSFLTMEAVLVDTTSQSSTIPNRVIAVVIMPMRVASFLFSRNFIALLRKKGFGDIPRLPDNPRTKEPKRKDRLAQIPVRQRTRVCNDILL